MAVISIHQNSYPSSDVHGAQVFYPQGSEKSKQLADHIQSALINGLDPNNHREAKANAEYYLFRDKSLSDRYRGMWFFYLILRS